MEEILNIFGKVIIIDTNACVTRVVACPEIDHPTTEQKRFIYIIKENQLGEVMRSTVNTLEHFNVTPDEFVFEFNKQNSISCALKKK